MDHHNPLQHSSSESLWRLFTIFLRLGTTSFGGPVAHIAYFRATFVERLAWLTPARFAELLALCQFLPGPASSQLGMAIGASRAGIRGAIVAWLGFTLPSALLMLGAGRLFQTHPEWLPGALLHGLKVMTIAIVVQALLGMGRMLCQTRLQIALMLLSTLLALASPGLSGQLAALLCSALTGALFSAKSRGSTPQAIEALNFASLRVALCSLLLFFMLLLLLPLLAQHSRSLALTMLDLFYRAGALVFGGGHVVLPLLQSELVTTGWIDIERFLAGYGLAQALPGPLFTFSAFLGAAMIPGSAGWWLGGLALLAIFLPSFLLVVGTLPLWERLREQPVIRHLLSGLNASVVGLLLAALIDPIGVSAITGVMDLLWAAMGFIVLQRSHLPVWAVVIGGSVLIWLFSSLIQIAQ